MTITMKHQAYLCEWAGTTDADDLGGVASFKVNGMAAVSTLHLSSFREFQLVQGLIDAAIYEGERRATQNLRAQIIQALGPVSYE